MNTITSDFKLEIYSAPDNDWVDYTCYLRTGTLSIDYEVNQRSTMTLTLYDWDGNMVIPQVGQQIRVSDVKGGTRKYYFGGQIALTTYGHLANAGEFIVDVRCQDWTSLLDRYYATKSYSNATLGSIVADLIAEMDYRDALTITDVATGPIISSMNIPGITLQEALDELMRETGYKYWTTADKALHVQPKTASTVSWDLNAENALTRVYGLPKVTRDRSQYRNVQEIIGGGGAGSGGELYPSSGNGLIVMWSGFNMYGYQSPPVIDLGRPINKIYAMVVSADPDDITDDEYSATEVEGKYIWGRNYPIAETGSTNAPFVYTPGDHYVKGVNSWTEADGTTSWMYSIVPLNGVRYAWFIVEFMDKVSAKVEKTSKWCTENGVEQQDTIEQMRAIEGGSGRVQRVESDEKLTTVQACEERASALLKEFGTIPTVVSYVSDDWDDLAIGMTQHVEIYDLNKDCLVRGLRISDVKGTWLRAEIELVGSEKQSLAQFWGGISAGRSAQMQSFYAIRENELPVQTLYIADHAATVSAHDILVEEVASAGTWGAGKIGGGAEWA